MTTDLIMLTASAVLTGALVLPYGLAMWALWPVREVLGNRETPPPLPPWAERARRAQHNMLENFPQDRKSTRLNSSHLGSSYADFCLKKKNQYKDVLRTRARVRELH